MKGSAEKPHRFLQRKLMRIKNYHKQVESFVDKTIHENDEEGTINVHNTQMS